MRVLQVRAVKRVSPSFTLEVDFGVSFREEKPIAALFGPTGCGKSTTLAAIAGLLPGVEGSVVLDDQAFLDTEGRIDLPPERRGIGWVPQDGLLFPHLTVDGNLRYGQRRTKRTDPALVDRVVDTLELGALLDRRPGGLSGGERQRVALGRAILSGPLFLLLDEPVSALDEASRFRALAFLERVVAEFRIPALYVSHSRAEVLRLASFAVRMRDGRVDAEGDPAEVLGAEPSAASVESLLLLEPAPGGGATARLGGRTVTLAAPLPGPHAGWARVSSAAVMLAHAPPTDLSARNALPGRVISLSEAGGAVRVAVDVGQPLYADVTPASAENLGLAPGAEVVCVFKARSLEPIA